MPLPIRPVHDMNIYVSYNAPFPTYHAVLIKFSRWSGGTPVPFCSATFLRNITALHGMPARTNYDKGVHLSV